MVERTLTFLYRNKTVPLADVFLPCGGPVRVGISSVWISKLAVSEFQNVLVSPVRVS